MGLYFLPLCSQPLIEQRLVWTLQSHLKQIGIHEDVFFWYRWRGALPPDLSSVVWRTVRLASLHCRYIAAKNLPPFAKRLARHQSGGCLFALRSPQASDGPRTTYLTRAPLPHPLHSHPQVVFLSFISVSVCLLHAPCGCARVYARVRRGGKKWQLRATRWQRCSLFACKLFFLHRKWC